MFRCSHLYNCRKLHVGTLYFASVFQRSGVLHRVTLATLTLFRSPAEAPRGTPFKLLPGASFVPNLIRKRYAWGDKPVGAPNQSVSREVARLYAPGRGEHSAAEASPNSGDKWRKLYRWTHRNVGNPSEMQRSDSHATTVARKTMNRNVGLEGRELINYLFKYTSNVPNV